MALGVVCVMMGFAMEVARAFVHTVASGCDCAILVVDTSASSVCVCVLSFLFVIRPNKQRRFTILFFIIFKNKHQPTKKYEIIKSS